MKLPRFEIETVEDMYTYYVIMNGLDEDVFWYSECNVLMTILANKSAYEAWKAYAEEKMMERK